MVAKPNILSLFRSLIDQLWSSVTSSDFYYEVYKSYRGYGLKYLFTLSFIYSLILCAFFLNNLMVFSDYFIKNKISKKTETIDYIIQQLPEIYYDGKNITTEAETPIYLKTKNNLKVAVIDPDNVLPYAEREKLLLVFTSSNIMFFSGQTMGNNHLTFSVDYSKIFGSQSRNLNSRIIKEHFAKEFAKVPTLFIYLLLPILVLKNFVNFFLDKIIAIIVVYILTNISKIKTEVRTCIRLVLFASGSGIILQPLVFILSPKFEILLFILHMWTNLLLFLGLTKAKNSLL